MKKLLLSFFVIFTFGFYAVYQRQLKTPSIANINENKIDNSTTNTTVIPTTKTTLVPKVVVPTTLEPITTKPKKYKDGTYTGKVADAFYGNIQVQAVINNGRLVEIVFLDYPHDQDTSREINSLALPLLREEAILAQSAKVDGVSGASASSPAFIESLGSALASAKN